MGTAFSMPTRSWVRSSNGRSRPSSTLPGTESYYNFVRLCEIHHLHEVARRRDIAGFFQFMVESNGIELGNLQRLLICGEKSFAAARSRLVQSFDLAVPLPHLNEALQTLSQAYAWGDINEVSRENTTEHVSLLESLPPDLFQALRAANAEDQALYDFCDDSWRRFRQPDPCGEQGPAGRGTQFGALSLGMWAFDEPCQQSPASA